MDLQSCVKKAKEKLRSFGIKEWGMVLVAGLCCLVIVFPTGDKKSKTGQETKKEIKESQMAVRKEETDYVERMENRLEELLSGVEDVGKVEVMITVSGTVEKSVLQDGTVEREQMTESDSAGGSRNSVSERSDGVTVFYQKDGVEIPYILSETYPEISGVVVIAQGSGTGTVDFDILNAVQVLFDVPAHKIKIMKMK